MRRDCDVLIVGGGLNGPVLALALASGGVSSIVLDSQPPDRHADPDFDGRAYALSLSTRKMLGALDLWSAVGDAAQAINEIKISDGRPGEGTAPWYLHFDAGEIDEGPMGHFLEDRFLRTAVIDRLRRTDLIEHRPSTEVVAQAAHPGGVSLTLSDGETLTADLVAGCDGRSSGVAQRAGIRRTGWEYRQTALVCAVDHEQPHLGIAHQLFLPAGPLAILPLPGNRSSIVWTEERARAAAIQALPPAAYLAELRPRFGDFLGGIDLAGARYTYPLGLSLADAFVAERVALAGDAAHGIHPLAGQGLNLGLRDVAALAEVVIGARRRGLDIGAPDVLAGYARWRRVDTALLATATDGLNRLFSNDNPLLRLGRDLGLGLVDRLPALRRGLIREAAGLNGDLPRLLRGQAI
jgi:2-octaprenyl-6-methoxyphenol hydroxylase